MKIVAKICFDHTNQKQLEKGNTKPQQKFVQIAALCGQTTSSPPKNHPGVMH